MIVQGAVLDPEVEAISELGVSGVRSLHTVEAGPLLRVSQGFNQVSVGL